jgi:hypothetical protein
MMWKFVRTSVSELALHLKRDRWLMLLVAGAAVAVLFQSATRLRSPRATIGSLLADGTSTPTRSSYAAYLVLRSRDCNGSLGFLRLLSRPAVAQTLTLRNVWLVGSAEASDSVAAALQSYGVTGVAVRSAPAALVDLLLKMGIRRSPVLLVTDTMGTFRHAFDAPATPVEYVAVAQGLEGLTPSIP